MADPNLLDGRYKVDRVVSTGGRARVLDAFDTVLDCRVALKMYARTDDLDDDFLSEIRVLRKLAHAGLPRVTGDIVLRDSNEFGMVLDWVDGPNLHDVLDDEGDPALPLKHVLDVVEQVADALDYLHQQAPPIVHGDVKPENLIRAAGDRIVLVDFDIATAEGGDERLGTPGFVAPEVAAGERSPAADVYGLAKTAMTLLNGHLPVDGERPTYPGLPPTVQSQVARVLGAGVATNPAERPKSAGKLAANLRAAASADPPSGLVALLAYEVADSARLWSEDPAAVSLGRIGDVRDRIVSRHGGMVATSMNEGGRAIAVFPDAPAAAAAALGLHERISSGVLPPGIDVQLRAGLAVGEATWRHGEYVGAVVDHVLRLRETAMPGTTLLSEPTAARLVAFVGADLAIVPLADRTLVDSPEVRLFVLVRPGADAEVGASLPGPARASNPVDIQRDTSRRVRLHAAADAIQHPVTLTAGTVAGVAMIYRAVLSSELGLGGLAAIVTAVGAIVAIASFVRVYRSAMQDHKVRLRRAAARTQLLDRLPTTSDPEVATARHTIEALGAGIDATTDLLQRSRGSVIEQVASELPHLCDEVYEQGVALVATAIDLLVLRHDAAIDQARALLVKAERCAAALADCQVQLAASRDVGGDGRDHVNDLDDTVALVRHVRDELSQLEA